LDDVPAGELISFYREIPDHRFFSGGLQLSEK